MNKKTNKKAELFSKRKKLEELSSKKNNDKLRELYEMSTVEKLERVYRLEYNPEEAVNL